MKSKAKAHKKQGGAVPAKAQEGSPIQSDTATVPLGQSKAVAQAKERDPTRRPRFGVKVDPSSTSVMKLTPDFGGLECHQLRLLNAFGTASRDFACLAVSRLAAIARHAGADLPTEAELNAALAAVDGLNPASEVEAMLAMQMYVAHNAALEMMERMRQATTMDAIQNYGAMATKMMRTYTTQVGALNKLRRGGEQTVRVEHVHVHAGGQAIVGAVTHPHQGGGGTPQNQGQPHGPIDPQALAFAPGTPVWSEEQSRDALPVTPDKREDTVPVPRRGQGKRGTNGRR